MSLLICLSLIKEYRPNLIKHIGRLGVGRSKQRKAYLLPGQRSKVNTEAQHVNCFLPALQSGGGLRRVNIAHQ